jgi:3-oxoacyl-[acyl-carrier protein] reductase
MTQSPTPVTLITGTRKGLGYAMAQHYCALGHHVVGCSRQPLPPDHTLPNTYTHVTLDITDEVAVKALFSQLKQQHGRLDNLINNAGIAAMNHSLLTPMSQVQAVLNTNVFGTFLVAREAAKLMQRNKPTGGRIINMATVATPLHLAGEAIYAASKAAVVTLTQIMAKEFAPFGITVNAVGPTPIATDLIKGVPVAKLEALVAQQAIPRMGTATDVLNVIDFYLQPASAFITGQVLYLGGVS